MSPSSYSYSWWVLYFTPNPRSMKTIRTLVVLALLIARPVPAQSQMMYLHVINVGQGSAMLVEFPCGVMLVDTGGESNELFQSTGALMNYLDDFFTRRTDLN